jgi:rhodanese-related sulfurtransferase
MPAQALARRPWGRVLAQAAGLVVLAIFLGLGRNALSSKPLPLFQTVNPLANDTLGIRRLDSLQVRAAWEKHQALFLDDRASDLFHQGHIPGAKSLPLDDFDQNFPKMTLSRDSAYVTYCEGKDCEYAELLAQKLYAQGYRKLAVFPGGWEEWTKGKYPLEK